MANPEHVEILKQGVEVWNEWRHRNPAIGPDLSEGDFCGGDFSEADFSQTDFIKANFNKANLKGANLHSADLTGTNLNKSFLYRADLSEATLNLANLVEARLNQTLLRGANLRRAYLTEASLRGAILEAADLRAADFTWADLNMANLTGTDLLSTNFSGADLSETNLSNAKISNTIFADTNLSTVKGLTTINHQGRSIIDISTLYQSRDQIPEVFLRGCGLPDDFIIYVRSLTAQAIQFYSCFISYSSKDQSFAERLYADLQNKGVRCWFAPEDLKIGDKIRDRIDESIRLRDKLLLILSENSIASDWVEHEVESALEEEKQRGRTILFPIRLDDAVMDSNKAWASLIRRTRHVGDFTRWKDHDSYQKAFDRLLRDLKAGE
jgi:uncharacterized protein YjbI with pentapeptide repeats